MPKEVYSTTKTAHHPNTLIALRERKHVAPVHVEIILSDLCNQDCGFCAYRMSGYSSNELFQIEEGQSRKARNPNRQISYEKAVEIINDCAAMGVKAIQFTGGGEPTIHPNFAELVDLAQGHGMDTALVTNGVKLTSPGIRQVVRRMKWVRVSIDAGSSLTYESIRNVPSLHWRLMQGGVQELAQEIANSPNDLTLGAGFVVTPDNWREIYDAMGLYKEWGFHNARIGLMFNPDGSHPYDDFRDEMLDLARRATKDHTDENFTVINRTAEKIGELDQGSPDFTRCSFQHFTTYIGGDLNVYRCCVLAYNLQGKIGSIADRSFKDFWFSEEVRKDLYGLDPTKCPRCQFSDINKNTNAIVEHDSGPPPWTEPPGHVNFV